MAYNIQTTSMLIGSISQDDIKIIFNPKAQKLYTGDSIKIIDEDKQGIVAQIYQIEHLDLNNITDDSIRTQVAQISSMSSNTFNEDFGSLHIANCKIKLSIIGNKWVNWRGNLPSTADYVDVVPPNEIISHTIGASPLNPVHLGNYVSHNPVPLRFEASILEKPTLIVGDKAKEKVNLVNILQHELISKNARVLIIDPKGGYCSLKNAKILEAGKNIKLSLIEYGLSTLGSLISSQIEPTLKLRVENLFIQLTSHAMSIVKGFIPLRLLRELLDKEINTPEGQKRFAEINTLRTRLVAIEKLGIFANSPEEIIDVSNVFNESNLIVFDISSIPLFWQKVFIRSVLQDLISSDVCTFVFYEDVFKYIDQELSTELVYKTKNLGLNNIFITNYEDEIPSELIKQSDNLFMFFTDSLESNAQFFNNLKSDKCLLNMLLKRIPENTVLINGEISNFYSLIVELKDINTNALTNKHFGTVKKYVSEYGEVIYSYKSDTAPSPAPQKSYQEEMSGHWESAQQQQVPKGYEDFGSYSGEDIDEFAPATYQQSQSYMAKYQNVSEEYEEELMELNSFQDDVQGINLDDEFISFQQEVSSYTQPSPQTIAHHIPDEEFLPQQQRMHQQIHTHKDSIAHQFPDEEFLPQQIQQQRHQQQRPQQQSPQSQSIHQIPDEEFIPQQMQQPQRMPQQRPQAQHPQQQPLQQPQQHPSQVQKEHIVHQIPDEEFIPQQMQQPQRMPQQRPQPQHPQQPLQQPQQRQQQPPARPGHQHQSTGLRPDSIPQHVEDIPVYAAQSLTPGAIDFEEGDKVHHERYGVGIINRIITTGDKQLCSIQFQEYGRRLLDPKRGLTKIK